MKTRNIKEMPLKTYKTITKINLLLTRKQFLTFFTETAPEVERNKVKDWQSLKIHWYFHKIFTKIAGQSHKNHELY